MITTKDFSDIKEMMEYFDGVPYDVTHRTLYSADDLYDGYDGISDSFEGCYDSRVYQHFIQNGKQTTDVKESLARTLHDHGIHVALDEFFQKYPGRQFVGVMGGHALLRTDPIFREIVLFSKQLTELGFYMLSGGGPGAMEATHLGAWMAGQNDEAVEDALKILSVAPSFTDASWLASAFKVKRLYQQRKFVSLGIPTWLYGHEPTTPFATHIAKFFENSIREDSILTLAYGGIVYTPGSAGTMQEIFQDAVQNHYLSFGFSSPMIFMGKDYWTQDMPIYPLLENLVKTGKYKNLLLLLTDNTDDVIKELVRFRDNI